MESAPDDRSILDDDPIWRRVVHGWIIRREGADPRISSAAFCHSSDDHATSVVLARVVAEGRRSMDDVLAAEPTHGIVELKASVFRSEHCGITRDPTDEEPAHALVRGRNGPRVRKRIARQAVIRRMPRGA